MIYLILKHVFRWNLLFQSGTYFDYSLTRLSPYRFKKLYVPALIYQRPLQ